MESGPRGAREYALSSALHRASHRGPELARGRSLSYADLAAAAHLSCVDYLGDATWAENENAKAWYARVKSRPSFRPLLSERLAGMAPSPTYADLDF